MKILIGTYLYTTSQVVKPYLLIAFAKIELHDKTDKFAQRFSDNESNLRQCFSCSCYQLELLSDHLKVRAFYRCETACKLIFYWK